MARHVHADHIIAAANDTTIEWQFTRDGQWVDVPDGRPSWNEEREYRQKPAQNIHKELMDIAKAYPSIKWQCSTNGFDWQDCIGSPIWGQQLQYRQKPTPSPHQNLMDIEKADPSIQWQVFNLLDEVWMPATPSWDVDLEYRQKPKSTLSEPEPDGIDTEAIAWAYQKLLAFGVGSNMDSAMMLDRLHLMLLESSEVSQ